jgi:hypothetical protein
MTNPATCRDDFSPAVPLREMQRHSAAQSGSRKRLTEKKACISFSAFCRILKAESIIHFLSRM